MHARRPLHVVVPTSCSLLLVMLEACAVNPATGERQLMFVSEAQEIAMGQESDPAVTAMFGLYPDSAWQRYVRGLGESMATQSERPTLPWSFRVVDDPIVNAFALPGGFIYVSRGILAHFDSEAQLASVLGHEIGHVTARHSASQMTQQQLFGIGLVAGAVLAPDVAQRYGGLASQAVGLLFLRFSRDDERQADLLGFRYMTRDGYDAREMPGVFQMLGRVTEAAGAGDVPGWLLTHPQPEDREQRIEALIAQSGRDFTDTRVARPEYIRRLDGMIYGANPREGFFRGQVFLHPDLEFQIVFPAQWKTQNAKTAVLAQSPQSDAVVQLTGAGDTDPVSAARELASSNEITAGSIRSGDINGFPAANFDFTAVSDGTRLSGSVTFISFGGSTYRILGFGVSNRWSAYAGDIQRTMESFDRLTDRSALSVQPLRLEIVELDRSMTMTQFVQRYPSPEDTETLATLNQVDVATPMPAGTLVKRVVGTPVR